MAYFEGFKVNERSKKKKCDQFKKKNIGQNI